MLFVVFYLFFFFFFFSSRRRHTRSLCDWSSDVCSSDLVPAPRAYGRLRADGGAVVAIAAGAAPSRGQGVPAATAGVGGEYVLEPWQQRLPKDDGDQDRKSTRLNSSHTVISYAVFCLKKKKPSKHSHVDG